MPIALERATQAMASKSGIKAAEEGQYEIVKAPSEHDTQAV